MEKFFASPDKGLHTGRPPCAARRARAAAAGIPFYAPPRRFVRAAALRRLGALPGYPALPARPLCRRPPAFASPGCIPGAPASPAAACFRIARMHPRRTRFAGIPRFPRPESQNCLSFAYTLSLCANFVRVCCAEHQFCALTSRRLSHTINRVYHFMPVKQAASCRRGVKARGGHAQRTTVRLCGCVPQLRMRQKAAADGTRPPGVQNLPKQRGWGGKEYVKSV